MPWNASCFIVDTMGSSMNDATGSSTNDAKERPMALFEDCPVVDTMGSSMDNALGSSMDGFVHGRIHGHPP